jgi:adenylylsulfate kinase-like enzyme
MKYQLKIEHTTKQIYIKCPYCNEILITNDPKYIPESARNGKLWTLGGCKHFEVIDVYKDPVSLEHNKQNFEKAVLVIEKKKYFILIVPRES